METRIHQEHKNEPGTLRNLRYSGILHEPLDPPGTLGFPWVVRETGNHLGLWDLSGTLESSKDVGIHQKSWIHQAH